MKAVFMVAALLVGSYANALTLKRVTMDGGKTNLNPSVPCALDIFPSRTGAAGAMVIINGEKVYGFTVSNDTVKELAKESKLKDAVIAGQLERSGDKQLSITVLNNEIVSYTYQAIDDRTNEQYGVSCNF